MVVDPKKRTNGPLLFGWCIKHSEDHANCRESFVDANGKERVCECSCHRKKSKRPSAR